MNIPEPPDSFLTLAGESQAEIKVQRSKFIAIARPAVSVTEAKTFISSLAQRYHDSRHVCFGWRLGYDPAVVENRSDAGEPSGTAGEPILGAIRKRELADVVVVVVRYFGGVKLGTGGLQRAYGQAAEMALEAAPIREVLLGREFEMTFPYPLQKTLRHLLEPHGGRIINEDYAQQVTWKIWLPHSTWQRFATDLKEASAGSVDLKTTVIPP